MRSRRRRFEERIRSVSTPSVLLAVLMIATACGGGAGGDDSMATTPIPEPSASAPGGSPSPPSPTPKFTPLRPPTPGYSDDIVLGVGYVWQGRPGDRDRVSAPVIFRLAAGSWTAVEPQVPENALLLDVTFSSETTAWAWGWVGNDGSFLIKSEDAGETWNDATQLLPEVGPLEGLLLTDLWFRNDEGWAVAGGLLGGLWVARSRDEGQNWSEVEGPFGPARLGHTFGSRGGIVEIFSNANTFQRADPVGPPMSIGPSDFRGRAFATFDDRGWIGGSDPFLPAIISAAQGELWEDQPLDVEDDGKILAIDFRDSRNGLACGYSYFRDRPANPVICFFTTNGGEEWQRAAVPSGALTIEGPLDVVWGPDDGAWLTTWTVEPLTPVLLHSEDGGRTWEHADLPFAGEGLIRQLARSSETRGR